MYKYAKYIIGFIALIFLIFGAYKVLSPTQKELKKTVPSATADELLKVGATVCITQQGCTGTSSPSGILYGDNSATTRLNTVTIGSGLTFSGGTLSSSGASYPFGLAGNATSTLTQFNGGLTAYASSTIGAGGQTTGLTINGGATTTSKFTLSGTAANIALGSNFLSGDGDDEGINVTSAGLVRIGTAASATASLDINTAPADDTNLLSVTGTYTNTTASTNGAISFSPTFVIGGSNSHTFFRTVPTINVNTNINTLQINNNNATLSASSGNVAEWRSLTTIATLTGTYTGTVTDFYGHNCIDNTVNGGQLLNSWCIYVDPQNSASSTVGIQVADLTSVNNNAGIVTGITTIPTGDWDAYFNADYPVGFIATSTATTTDKAVFKSLRGVITTNNLIGGIGFWSDDTNLTAPGQKVAGIQAIATQAHTGSALGTSLLFQVTPNSTTALSEVMRIDQAGNLGVGTTSPQRRLHATNVGDLSQLLLEDSAAAANQHYGSFGFSRGLLRYNTMTDALASTTRFLVDSNGNFGVATTSPWGLMSINPSGIAGPSFVVGSSTATSLIVTNGGNVGIASTSPAATLGVVGNAMISGVVRVLGQFVTVIAAAFTPSIEGEVGIDTTDNQLKFYSGSAVRVLSPNIESAFVLATSTLGTGTTTIKVSGFPSTTTFGKFGCTSSGSGTFVAVLGDSAASTTPVVSGTSLTTTFTTLSSNNAFTAGETVWYAIGSVSGTVVNPSCSYQRTVDAT